jgi:hypothetical protein
MITDTFIVYENSEGSTEVWAFEKIDMDKFFYRISKHYAFSDCSMEHITRIYYKGKEIEYVGWQPNMKFEYKDRNSNTIWIGEFPEWNH